MKRDEKEALFDLYTAARDAWAAAAMGEGSWDDAYAADAAVSSAILA